MPTEINELQEVEKLWRTQTKLKQSPKQTVRTQKKLWEIPSKAQNKL